MEQMGRALTISRFNAQSVVCSGTEETIGGGDLQREGRGE